MPHNSLELGPGDGAWRGGGGAGRLVPKFLEAGKLYQVGSVAPVGTWVHVLKLSQKEPAGRRVVVSHQWGGLGVCHTSGLCGACVIPVVLK